MLLDQVMFERNGAETITKGGIMLPEKCQGKILQAAVVAVDLGSRGKGEEIQPVNMKGTDKFFLHIEAKSTSRWQRLFFI